MKVSVYPEGEESRHANYDLPPQRAAQVFAEFRCDAKSSANLCVTPLDDEARALVGWHHDEDDVQFKMFVATPSVQVDWSTHEVATFNPHAKETP